MKLTDIRIGAPLLQIETRIFHTTPRKPTAFERVILSMADRFGADDRFNDIPLERLFVDVLGVADPSPLVTPTLTELIALDVIRCTSDIEALDTLILRDIEITERGYRMIAEDMLPAKSMQNDEVFFYDPINQRLLPESQAKAYRPAPPAVSVDATVFEDVFPEDQIRSNIQSGAFRWFGATSQIESLESQSVQIFWKDTLCSVECDNGELAIVSKDEGLSTYIRSLDCDTVYGRFVEPVFGKHDLPIETFPEIDVEALKQANSDILPVSYVLSDWPESARIVIPNSDHVASLIPEQAPPQQVTLHYHDQSDLDDIHFEWNENHDGCKLRIKATHPDPDCLMLTEKHEIRCRQLRVMHGEYDLQLLVACRNKINSDNELINRHLGPLSSRIDQSVSLDDHSVVVLWEGEALYRRNLLRRLAQTNNLRSEVIKGFYAGLSHVERIVGSVDRNAWNEALLGYLCESIDSCEVFEWKLNGIFLETLSKYGPFSKKHTLALVQSLSEKVPLPHNLDELKEISTYFRTIDSDWTPDFPSRLMTPEIIQKVIEGFPGPLDPVLLSEGNGFFGAVSSLRDCYEKICKILGEKGVDGLVDDDDYVALIKAQPDVGLADLAHSWASEMESLSSALVDYGPVLTGTRLETIDGKVTEIGRWAAKLVGALAKNIHSVYVFDTSALIAQPRIVASISPNELFVVTKRVIDELDDKKLDETLRPSVAEAVRNLRRIRKEQIQFCDGDMSLLPKDYRMKGDNLILSVAVRFRKHKPTLITNDNNLSLKAQAEGIAVMTSEEFDMRKRPKPQLNDQVHRGHAQNSKGKSGKNRGRK